MKTENKISDIIQTLPKPVYTCDKPGFVNDGVNARIMKATLDARENERQQIGFELHDNINQILTGCLLNLGINKNSSPEQAAALIEKSKEYILKAISEIRKLSHRLAPSFFDKDSIKKSFEELIQMMNVNNQFNIKFHFDSFTKTDISQDINLNLYRILLEQLTNMVKYSKATAAEVSIEVKANHIIMRIFDNGIGFKSTSENNGIGIRNMKKRVQVLSGNFTLNTSPGNGCEIIVSLPLDNKTKTSKLLSSQKVYQYPIAG
jgi:signal transduction histidine kinase